DTDALLQLRLLELDADALLQRVRVTGGIEAEHRGAPRVGLANALDAFHGRGLAGAVGPDESKDLALEHLEGDVVDRHSGAVQLAQVGHLDDPPRRRGGGWPRRWRGLDGGRRRMFERGHGRGP